MSSLRIFVSCLILGAGFASSAAAQEPNGYPITDVNLRAGPGTEYPVILTVPADAPITILGCLPDYTWCDSVFENYRGWMSAVYLSGYSEGDYYLLRDYAPDLGYQRVTFNIDAYWDSYYRDEPFYGDRGRWARPREAGWVDDGVFYDRLSPHGSWTWIQGRYVWVPANVDRGWRPYTRGRWVYTDRGWTWASNEPFGWATYHYGRWGFSDRVGWFWTPGNQWAPAWVSWRQSDDYLAWAPLPPSYDRGYDRGYDSNGGGLNINISFGDVPDYYWSMVPSRDFLSDDLPRYYVNDRDRRRRDFERTRPVGHTKIVNKTVVNNVVNVNYVEQKTKKKVVKRRIARTDDAEAAGKVEDDTLEVYEPEADEKPEAKGPPEPKDVEEVAKASETKAQAEGEATTEDMLAPKEVQEAAKERKGGKGRKAKAAAKAEGKNEGVLPEGEIADAPPPAKDKTKAKEKPVPAHEVAAPKASDVKPDTEAKEPAEEKDAAPKTAEPEKSPEPEKKAEPAEPKPDAAETEPGDKEKPAAAETEQKGKKQKPVEAEKSAPKDAGKDKPAKPGKKNAAPAGKAPEPTEPKDETPLKEEKPAEAEQPVPSGEPEKKEPEAKEPEAEKAAPKEPEAKKAEPKPEPKKEPKPGPKKPEAKKPEVKKPAPKPEAKKPAPKPEAKKPAPQKREARTPERNTPPAAKREAKEAPGKAKPTGRTAQGPAPEAKGLAKGKKGPEKNPESN